MDLALSDLLKTTITEAPKIILGPAIVVALAYLQNNNMK